MAAGQVLVVMLVALVLGAMLNAERMQERAEQKPLEDSWRDQSVWIWSRVHDVSRPLGLTMPRRWIEDRMGRTRVADEDRVPISSPTPGGAAAGPPGPSSPAAGADEGEETAASTTTTVPDHTPEVRAPTPEEPLRLWVGGDSMVQTLGSSMQRATGSTGIIQTTFRYEVSSGLTRRDQFDWPTYLRDSVLPTDPEVMVIMFGANDSQGLLLDDGSVCRRFEQCWLDEYRARVAATMDLVRSEDDDRLVIWVGQPIMRPGTVLGLENLNAIYWEEARQRDWVVFFDSWPYFGTEEGEYAQFLASANGSDAEMRLSDGIHLSIAGGDRLAWELLVALGEHVDLSAWDGDPPRSALAPDDIEPREELPPPAVGLID
jgi:uncharacterized protein